MVILANKNTSNPNLEDHTNILSTFSVKNYVKRLTNQDIRVCLQILKPENKDLLYGNLEDRMRVNQVICVEELKLFLLAKTCICPGINTIISILITCDKPNLECNTIILLYLKLNYYLNTFLLFIRIGRQ